MCSGDIKQGALRKDLAKIIARKSVQECARETKVKSSVINEFLEGEDLDCKYHDDIIDYCSKYEDEDTYTNKNKQEMEDDSDEDLQEHFKKNAPFLSDKMMVVFKHVMKFHRSTGAQCTDSKPCSMRDRTIGEISDMLDALRNMTKDLRNENGKR